MNDQNSARQPVPAGAIPPVPRPGTAARNLADEDGARHAARKRRSWLIRAAHGMGVRVRHPDGGDRPVEEILQDEAAQRAQIETERRDGSRKHHRLPAWIRHIPKLVMVFDFCLLLYFFSGVTDVNWVAPLSAALLFALLLAATVTAPAYGLFSYTGHQLRLYKDHSGAVRLGEADGLTKIATAACVVGIAILSSLMFVRMHAEVINALGSRASGTAILIALTLATVSVLANFLVIGIHAHDGSYEVDRLNKLSATVRRVLADVHRSRTRAARHLG